MQNRAKVQFSSVAEALGKIKELYSDYPKFMYDGRIDNYHDAIAYLNTCPNPEEAKKALDEIRSQPPKKPHLPNMKPPTSVEEALSTALELLSHRPAIHWDGRYEQYESAIGYLQQNQNQNEEAKKALATIAKRACEQEPSHDKQARSSSYDPRLSCNSAQKPPVQEPALGEISFKTLSKFP